MKTFLISGATMLLAAMLTLAATEGALRFFDHPNAPPVGWNWDKSPYRNQPDTATNQLGLRGRPIQYEPEDFVVILLGDSQVEAGTRVPDQMPERILERVLQEQYGIANARVFSVASAGWGTDQEYVNLKRYFQNYRADLVLLWFTAVNDYWENGYIDRSVQIKAGHFKPTYAFDGAGTLQSHAVVPAAKLQLLLEQGLARLSRMDYPDWRLHRWLASLPPSSAEQSGAPLDCPATVIEQSRMWGYEGESPITVATDEDFAHNRSHFSPFSKTQSEREKYQIRITQALLSQVAAEAQSHGAHFRFFYPYRPDLDMILSQVRCIRSHANGRPLAIDGNDLMGPLDTPQLRPYRVVFTLPPGRDVAVGEGDIHHNGKGNLLAMQGLADILLRQKLLPVRSAEPGRLPMPAAR